MSAKPVKSVPGKSHCLICDTSFDAKNPPRRGLCAKHYAQFKKMRDSVAPENVEVFESRLIADGKLLPGKQGQKGDGNQFADYAKDLLPPEKQSLANRAEALADLLSKPKRKGKE